jgi:hypothetical protein
MSKIPLDRIFLSASTSANEYSAFERYPLVVLMKYPRLFERGILDDPCKFLFGSKFSSSLSGNVYRYSDVYHFQPSILGTGYLRIVQFSIQLLVNTLSVRILRCYVVCFSSLICSAVILMLWSGSKITINSCLFRYNSTPYWCQEYKHRVYFYLLMLVNRLSRHPAEPHGLARAFVIGIDPWHRNRDRWSDRTDVNNEQEI